MNSNPKAVKFLLTILEMGSMHFITTLVLLSLLGAGKAQDVSNVSGLNVALAEMKAGSYYGFVMLLQMLLESGKAIPTTDVTFLMPNDSHLADHTSIAIDDIPDFLLRHTLTPLLMFNNLQHFPTGSLIPSSLPNYTFSVSNHGRRNFTLNNVRIVSPNVCRSSSSIACHGIGDVLPANTTHSSPPPPPPSPHSSPSPSPVPYTPLSPPPPPLAPAPALSPAPAPAAAPAPSSNGATPRAYISGPAIFICTIVVALARP